VWGRSQAVRGRFRLAPSGQVDGVAVGRLSVENESAEYLRGAGTRLRMSRTYNCGVGVGVGVGGFGAFGCVPGSGELGEPGTVLVGVVEAGVLFLADDFSDS